MEKLSASLANRTSIWTWLPMLVVATTAVSLAPQAAVAEERVPISGSFAVAFTGTPNTNHATYCGGSALPITVEAHGNGYSSVGPLSLSLQKTLAVPGDMHGCLALRAPNGDTLNAIYSGTEGSSNPNNFVLSASGTLTFTGGTGRFRNATGSVKFTAIFAILYPTISFAGGTSLPLQGMAFYIVDGAVSLAGD